MLELLVQPIWQYIKATEPSFWVEVGVFFFFYSDIITETFNVALFYYMWTKILNEMFANVFGSDTVEIHFRYTLIIQLAFTTESLK